MEDDVIMQLYTIYMYTTSEFALEKLVIIKIQLQQLIYVFIFTQPDNTNISKSFTGFTEGLSQLPSGALSLSLEMIESKPRFRLQKLHTRRSIVLFFEC